MHESTCDHSILISQLHSSNCVYSLGIVNFFNRATVHCTCKGDFRNSYFLQRAPLWEYLQPECLVGVLELLEIGTVKRTYLKHQIFVKTIYLFQNTTCSCLFRNVLRPFLIKAAVFSEQHWLYWNKNSHLKFAFFCRQKFLRILSCLEQLLLPSNYSWLQILVLVSYSLKINTFSGQLPFRRNLFSRISNYSEHVLFRSWCFFRRATFSLELF